MTNTLLYLCYGTGMHQQEAVFSVLSAVHKAGSGLKRLRIVVYTDDRTPFEGLPVEFRDLSKEELAAWDGPHGYRHRRKIMAMADSLERFPGKVVFLDSDTWFLRSPEALFRTVTGEKRPLHLPEGSIATVRAPGFAAWHRYLLGHRFDAANGAKFAIPSDIVMWNSGVVGLTSDDRPLMAEALRIVDQMTATFDEAPTAEQLALSHVIQAQREAVSSDGIVFHYWVDRMRRQFQDGVPQALAATAGLPVRERARRVYASRPRPSWLRLQKVAAKRLAQRAGFMRNRLRTSFGAADAN
ncbi:hypothetical protein [Aureimonas psammosilenae]|uniref:hypothetical protein n=1 Tax=Aureimonas psammosilenae TaxID=2495496 RepID=UPI0012605CE8|nr:hypothetical protein [Aureimonas psammosilenae]